MAQRLRLADSGTSCAGRMRGEAPSKQRVPGSSPGGRALLSYFASRQRRCGTHRWIRRPIRHSDRLGSPPATSEAAERAVRFLTGIKGVSNLITVRARPTPSDLKQKIREALRRGAEFDAERITVELDGKKAILRGTVRSYAEMRDAERAARNAPGVTELKNLLAIDSGAYAGVM
jgi:osmotically-inducible protein OsmY